MADEHPDSLDRDATRPGQPGESPGADARSLGDQSTRGGQDSPMSDVASKMENHVGLYLFGVATSIR